MQTTCSTRAISVSSLFCFASKVHRSLLTTTAITRTCSIRGALCYDNEKDLCLFENKRKPWKPALLRTHCNSGEITGYRYPTCVHGQQSHNNFSKTLFSSFSNSAQARRYFHSLTFIPELHETHSKKSHQLLTICRTTVLFPGANLLRHKTTGKKDKQQDEEQVEEDELDDDDYDAPPKFRKMTIHLKSLRADSLVSTALDISRNRVDEMFYGSRLMLNGEKLLKKSKQVTERDYVDLIVEKVSEEDKLMVKRVKVIGISPDKTNKDRTSVTVKVWKSAFPIPDVKKFEDS